MVYLSKPRVTIASLPLGNILLVILLLVAFIDKGSSWDIGSDICEQEGDEAKRERLLRPYIRRTQ